MIELKVLSKSDAEQIRLWRNQCLDTLRTPYPLTAEQQADWYENTVCNRSANARWFGVFTDYVDNTNIIGYTGIENISWENRIGEISLLIDPDEQHKGFGKDAVDAILYHAFYNLNLNLVYGECYYSNLSGIKFWNKIVKTYSGSIVVLPERKFTADKYFDSMYFTIKKP